ncbi:MAG: hypothetical protein E7560_02445 [Ruminococcaceae bacterium]|nr:hypothetical protein [Oscillospiraceae bacterium]
MKNKNSQFANIIITQGICVLIILTSVVVIKYFFKSTYKKLESFYSAYICSDTDINEVIGEWGSGE